MKKLFCSALFLLIFAAPSVRGQATADSNRGSKVHLINRLMRDVVIPANNPGDPDVIPIGYRAEMPGEGEARVAQRGDHFWLFTTELVNRNNLYEKWVAAGQPDPIADFARDQLAEEEFTLAADTAAAPPPEPAPAETTVATPAEASASSGGWSWLWIGALVLLVVLVLAYLWQRQGGRRERVA